MSNDAHRRFVVSVMSRDRVGIVRDITRALTQWHGNVEQVSQTVVMNYFTFILIAAFPEAHTVAAVRELLQQAGAPGELEIGVKEFIADAPTSPAADRFILTAIGGDKPGLVHHLATFCAGKGINITDLYGATTADNQFVVVSEVAVPRHLDLTQIQLDLEALGQTIGIAIHLQHENIFRATNEITAPGALA